MSRCMTKRDELLALVLLACPCKGACSCLDTMDGALLDAESRERSRWLSALSDEIDGVEYCVGCNMCSQAWPVPDCRVCDARRMTANEPQPDTASTAAVAQTETPEGE